MNPNNSDKQFTLTNPDANNLGLENNNEYDQVEFHDVDNKIYDAYLKNNTNEEFNTKKNLGSKDNLILKIFIEKIK